MQHQFNLFDTIPSDFIWFLRQFCDTNAKLFKLSIADFYRFKKSPLYS